MKAKPTAENLSDQGRVQTVIVDDDHTPTINTRYGFATVIALPPAQVIEDLVFGDLEHWSFHGYKGGHFCYIVPTKSKWTGQSNIHLVTKDGKDWPFHLTQATGAFDSKIIAHEPETPKVVSSCDVGLRMELASFKITSAVKQAELSSEVDGLKGEVSRRVDPLEFGKSLDYHISGKLRNEPFNVTKIYSLQNPSPATYVYSKSQREAAFYEKDGKKKIHVNYDPKSGLYIIPGIVTEGCLGIEKHTACFKKKG